MATRISPNGKKDHYDLSWGWVEKVLTGVSITLLGAAILGLFGIAIQNQRLSVVVEQMNTKLSETHTLAQTNRDALVSHLIEAERLKGLYLTKEDYALLQRSPIVVIPPKR